MLIGRASVEICPKEFAFGNAVSTCVDDDDNFSGLLSSSTLVITALTRANFSGKIS
jgi:hypothetical protein